MTDSDWQFGELIDNRPVVPTFLTNTTNQNPVNKMSYTVWVWYPDDWHMAELEHVEVEEALLKAKSLMGNVGARIGVVRRITIVDNSDDSTAFEWRYGEGITFPLLTSQ